MTRATTRLAAVAAILLSGTALANAQTTAQATAQQSNARPTTMDRVHRTAEQATGNPLANLDPDMRHVIDALGKLDPKPLPKLTATQARQQPSAADAAMQTLREQGKSSLPDPAVNAKNIAIPGAQARISATVYTPAGASGALPVIVYFHGGGFVIASNATYDSSARTLSKAVNAVVVAVEYSKAPEHKFPAAHDDAVAAYKWVTQNAASLGGDPAKIAIAGESAGGNLAVNTAIAARDQKLPAPKHLLVVYPMAGTNLDTQSYKDMANAKPLNKPMMQWFYNNLVRTEADMQDPRLDIVGKADLKGLPSVTLITDQIDPLNSEGIALGEKLKAAGVPVNAVNYDGVTHEFFGMGLVVGKAKTAEDLAAADLKTALSK